MGESVNVVRPIRQAARAMSVPSSAKVTPTASASMLVAIASSSIVLKPKSSLVSSSSLLSASRTMFTPIIASRMNATQWSNWSIRLENVVPRKYPSVGISA
mgnify:CR=1 FL=1